MVVAGCELQVGATHEGGVCSIVRLVCGEFEIIYLQKGVEGRGVTTRMWIAGMYDGQLLLCLLSGGIWNRGIPRLHSKL